MGTSVANFARTMSAEPLAVDVARTLCCPSHLQSLYRAYCVFVVARHYEHELRNTLGAISSSVFFLERRLAREDVWDADPRVAGALNRIDMRVKETARFLPNPSPISSHDPPTILSVGDVARRLLDELRAPYGVHIELHELDSQHIVARTDEVQLLLHCLIENAVEAIGMGHGRIDVRVGHRTLEVEDDGVRPVSESSPPEGRGFGAPIAQLLAKNLGATLELGIGRNGGLARLRLSAHEA